MSRKVPAQKKSTKLLYQGHIYAQVCEIRLASIKKLIVLQANKSDAAETRAQGLYFHYFLS